VKRVQFFCLTVYIHTTIINFKCDLNFYSIAAVANFLIHKYAVIQAAILN